MGAPALMGSTLGISPALVAVLGLIVMAVVAISSRKRAEGGKDVREFLRQGHNDKHGDEEEWPVRAEPEEVEATAQTEAAPAPAAGDLSAVGEHIASVLGAAEAAATKLRDEAEFDARTTREAAEREANEIRERARDEGQTIRVAAQQMLEEAEAQSADVRSKADRYSDERRREADAQSAKVVLEAERRAATITDTSKERHRVVLSNIATSEARLRDLAKSLRGVASALDTVVGDQPPEGADEAGDKNLEDSLRARTAPRTQEERAHP